MSHILRIQEATALHLPVVRELEREKSTQFVLFTKDEKAGIQGYHVIRHLDVDPNHINPEWMRYYEPTVSGYLKLKSINDQEADNNKIAFTSTKERSGITLKVLDCLGLEPSDALRAHYV